MKRLIIAVALSVLGSLPSFALGPKDCLPLPTNEIEKMVRMTEGFLFLTYRGTPIKVSSIALKAFDSTEEIDQIKEYARLLTKDGWKVTFKPEDSEMAVRVGE